MVSRESNYLPRFNFRKAFWESFSEQLDSLIYNLNPDPTQYQAFQNLVWKTAKVNIPRGCRRKYVPGLTDAGAELYKQYISQFESDPFDEQTKQFGESLLNQLTEERKARWKELITNIDLTHNSKKAWKTIKNLISENKPPSRVAAITPNQVAHQLLLNGKPVSKHNWSPKSMKMQFQQVMQDSSQTTKPISLIEVQEAIKHIKPGKDSGLDGITPEMINHLDPTTIKWILALFNQCLENSKIPNIWKKARVIALLKPGKTPDSPRNYRPISLLCVLYKVYERIFLTRVSTKIEEILSPDQAGFRPRKSCCGQVLNLTQYIEDGFERKLVTGAAFTDLSAAYDTVNHKLLLLKLAKVIKDVQIVRTIQSLLSNRWFFVELDGRKS